MSAPPVGLNDDDFNAFARHVGEERVPGQSHHAGLPISAQDSQHDVPATLQPLDELGSPSANGSDVRPPLHVGPGETFLGHTVDALPLGNLTTNALSAALLHILRPTPQAHLTPRAKEALAARGRGEMEALPIEHSLVDDYRDVRDTRRERDALGGEDNPTAAGIGTGVGIGLSLGAPLPGVSVNAGKVLKGTALGAKLGTRGVAAAGRLASGAATGAVYGTVGGATDGPADLTRGQVLEGMRDTYSGALGGAAFGLGGAAVGEGVRLAAPMMRRMAVRQAQEAIQGNSDIAAATRKPIRKESVEQMLDDGMVRGLDSAATIFERIEPAAKAEGEKLGKLIRNLEDRGFSGPDAKALAAKLMTRYEEKYGRSSSEKGPANVFKNEADNLLDPRVPKDDEGRLTISRAEDLKRDLQDRAHLNKLNLTGLEPSIAETASMLRQATEDSITAQAAERGRGDKTVANKFIPQKERTGKYLDALNTSQRAASKFSQRARVGLADQIAASNLAEGDTQVEKVLNSKVLGWLLAQAKNRGSSTLAVGLNDASKLATQPEAFGRAAAAVAPAAVERGRQWLDDRALQDLVDSDDPSLGPYGAVLRKMSAAGPEQLRVADKVLRDTDPEYRKMKERLSK